MKSRLQKTLFLICITLLVSCSGSTTEYEDGSVGQGIIKDFKIIFNDTLEDSWEFGIISVEGSFIWDKNVTESFIVDNNTAITNDNSKLNFTDLRAGMTVRIWKGEKNPYQREILSSTTLHYATKIIIISD